MVFLICPDGSKYGRNSGASLPVDCLWFSFSVLEWRFEVFLILFSFFFFCPFSSKMNERGEKLFIKKKKRGGE